MRRLVLGLIGLVPMVDGALLEAEVMQWMGNGHFYEVVLADNPTWYEALDAASVRTFNQVNGHLATVTTDAEQDFLVTSFGGGAAINALWVGGYQDTTDSGYWEPGGGWKWITEEPWNAGPDKPYFSFNNNYWFVETEEHLITWWNNGGLNDFYSAPYLGQHPLARGYIVEYVPEPSTLVLLGIGVVGLLLYPRDKSM